MLKIIITVAMLSVSTLAYADKWEYAELKYTYTGKLSLFTYDSPEKRVYSGGKLISKAYTDLATYMGWEKRKPTELIRVLDVLNHLGADGWEIVSASLVSDSILPVKASPY